MCRPLRTELELQWPEAIFKTRTTIEFREFSRRLNHAIPYKYIQDSVGEKLHDFPKASVLLRRLDWNDGIRMFSAN